MQLIRRKLTQAFVVLTTLLLTQPAFADPGSQQLIVLCYHEVEADGEVAHAAKPRESASPADSRKESLRYTAWRSDFRSQLDYLQTAGYHVVSLEDAVDYVTGKRPSLPENPVVITVDDGWLCTHDEILPEMQKRKLPFTLFVYPKSVGRGKHMLTWAQIRKLGGMKGVEIGSHSWSHPFLSRARQSSLAAEEYESWLKRELLESKEAIERETGRKVRYLAYPFGDFDEGVVARSASYGYEAALTCERGPNLAGTNPYRLKRFLIHNDTTLDELRGWLGALRLVLTGVKSGESGAPTVLAIGNHERLDPTTVGAALLGDPSSSATYDAKNGRIEIRSAKSTPDARYLVWGRDAAGRRFEGVWTAAPSAPTP